MRSSVLPLLLAALLATGSVAAWGSDDATIALAKTETTPISEGDEKLFDSCLSFVLGNVEGHIAPVSRRRPLKKQAPLDLTGTIAPPNLIRETVIVGDVPWQIRKYQGQWALRLGGKTPFPYAAFVERLTPTEMTIAHDPARLRQKLEWVSEEAAFVNHHANLFRADETITLIVGVSQFGDAVVLATANTWEAHLMGCLFSEQYP